MPPETHRLSEAGDDELRALTGTSGVLCDKCGSTGHNTAGHVDPAASCRAVLGYEWTGGGAERTVRCSLPTGHEGPHERHDQPAAMVYLVVWSDYDVHEVYSAWTTKEAAEVERDRLGAAWDKTLDIEEVGLDTPWE